MNINKKDRPVVVIDGLNVFIRHYLVNETINNKSEPIGGVVGFIRSLNYFINFLSPSKIFVVWESGGGSARRRSIFKEYKKDRGKIREMKKIQAGTASIRDQLAHDQECKVKQLALLYRLLKHTPVCQIFVSGTECDDIIAYLVTQKLQNESSKKVIVSGDKDFYQLLTEDEVEIYEPSKRQFITEKWLIEKFNITPENFCLARTLVGDKSDNLEGVPGVGLKTVAKRFPEVSNKNKEMTIDDILHECGEKVKKKAKQKVYNQIIESQNIVRRNWKLMLLSSNMLSAKEIAKINYAVDNHEPKMNKVSLIKEVISNGISIPFDFDSFASQMRLLSSR